MGGISQRILVCMMSREMVIVKHLRSRVLSEIGMKHIKSMHYLTRRQGKST